MDIDLLEPNAAIAALLKEYPPNSYLTVHFLNGTRCEFQPDTISTRKGTPPYSQFSDPALKFVESTQSADWKPIVHNKYTELVLKDPSQFDRYLEKNYPLKKQTGFAVVMTDKNNWTIVDYSTDKKKMEARFDKIRQEEVDSRSFNGIGRTARYDEWKHYGMYEVTQDLSHIYSVKPNAPGFRMLLQC